MKDYRPGVRVKLNLILLALLTATIGVLGWVDYRHEVQTVMAAHALHVVSTSDAKTGGPVDPSTAPEAVGRRALVVHGALGIVVLALTVLVVNWSVGRLVLTPIQRIRDRIDQMTRGEWRATACRASYDELGRLADDFGRLGLAVDALAGQLLYAERLATLALVSRRLEAVLLPAVQQTVAAVNRLQTMHPDAAHEHQQIASAAARIAAAVRGLDQCFEPGAFARPAAGPRSERRSAEPRVLDEPRTSAGRDLASV